MKIVALAGAALLVGAGGLGLWGLRQHMVRLQARAEDLRRSVRTEDRARERDENRRLAALLTQVRRGGMDATAALHAETEIARRELTEWERRAEVARVARAEREANRTENRDPALGFARLEHLQNVGYATPEAAFQTLIWAAMKGDAEALTTGVALTDAVRRRADDWLSRLPSGARENYPSPESLAALGVTDELLKITAVQILGSTLTDAHHAVVRFRRFETGEQVHTLPLKLGPGGWQVVLPDRAIDGVRKRIEGTPP